MTDEWNTLDRGTKAALERLIERARKEGGQLTEMHGGNEIYAYRHPTGRIAWGLNSGETGINVARGIKE